MRLGEAMRTAREAAGISMRKMGDRIGRGHAQLHRFELGKSPVPPHVVAAYESVIGLEPCVLSSLAGDGAVSDAGRTRPAVQPPTEGPQVHGSR